MRAKIVTQASLENAESGREPIAIGFDKVDKFVVEEGQLVISYMVAGKIKIQQLKLPVDKLHEVVLEFF